MMGEQTESTFAARYLAEQVVQSCGYVFLRDRIRQAQEVRDEAAAAQAGEPYQPEGDGGAAPHDDGAAPVESPSDMSDVALSSPIRSASPQAQEVEGRDEAPTQPRQITEQDRNFYREYRTLHTALAQADTQWARELPPLVRVPPIVRMPPS